MRDLEHAGDHEKVTETFRRLAPSYDRWTRRFEAPLLRRAVELLELHAGEVGVDWGCGTGQAFELLEERIGPEGRLIGVDLSPDMLALASARVKAAGWRNVSLIEAPIETASLRERADAAVLSFVPPVMRSEPALENAIGQLKPGGRVVAVGPRWPPAWSPLARLLLLWTGRRFGTFYDRQPWTLMRELVEGLEVQVTRMGAVFIARGIRDSSSAG
jgi:ubiquinone/menaquinone biosynthesis C-methylase UbiE